MNCSVVGAVGVAHLLRRPINDRKVDDSIPLILGISPLSANFLTGILCGLEGYHMCHVSRPHIPVKETSLHLILPVSSKVGLVNDIALSLTFMTLYIDSRK